MFQRNRIHISLISTATMSRSLLIPGHLWKTTQSTSLIWKLECCQIPECSSVIRYSYHTIRDCTYTETFLQFYLFNSNRFTFFRLHPMASLLMCAQLVDSVMRMMSLCWLVSGMLMPMANPLCDHTWKPVWMDWNIEFWPICGDVHITKALL